MKRLLVLLITLPLLGACAPSAEKFFAGGRRSQLSAVHREATASEKNMLKLYRVPARFPEATLEHKLAWQRAIVAWWWAPDKQDLMTRSVALLKPEEATAFFAMYAPAKMRAQPALSQNQLLRSFGITKITKAASEAASELQAYGTSDLCSPMPNQKYWVWSSSSLAE